MNRWNRGRTFAAALACAAAGLSLDPCIATAQTTDAQATGILRVVPQGVSLAKMTVTLPPVILINGKEDRLSPGSRIRDLNNMVALSGSLVGRGDLPVVYKRDVSGLVHEVWILSGDEFAQLAKVTDSNYGPALTIIWSKRK